MFLVAGLYRTAAMVRINATDYSIALAHKGLISQRETLALVKVVF